MVNAQQFERIQQLVKPITTISAWLLPKIVKVLVVGSLCLAWFVFFALQFWAWSYWWLIPLVILAVPVGLLAIWCLLLLDLADLPQALEDIKESTTGLKDRVTSPKKEAVKAAVRISNARQLPKLLRELFDLVQGIDAIRTVVTHGVFLANPLSWVFLVLSFVIVIGYSMVALTTALVWVV